VPQFSSGLWFQQFSRSILGRNAARANVIVVDFHVEAGAGNVRGVDGGGPLHGCIVRYFVVTAGRRPSPIYLNLFVLPICSHDKVSYNTLVLHNTTSTRPIHFHLQAAAIDAKPAAISLDVPSDIIDRSAFMYSVLDSGWIRVAYRKICGTPTIRLCTRNPTLVAKFGSRYDVEGIKNSEFDSDSVNTVVYFDHAAGGLRCFRVKNVDAAGIDAVSIENNH
jgi:hypothetical protein